MKTKVVLFLAFLALFMVMFAVSPLSSATLLNWKQLKVGDGVAGQALLSGGTGQEPAFADPIVSQQILGLLKTATTLYQTDNVVSDSTHGIYVQPASNAPDTKIKLSDTNWWTLCRSANDVVGVDSTFTDTKAGSAGHAWRVTGISVGLPCIAFWQVNVNGAGVYYGCTNTASDFAFPTPIKAGVGQSVGITVKVVTATTTSKLHYTLIGDE